jgi:tetratricopeptide (TPR) repeat protein
MRSLVIGPPSCSSSRKSPVLAYRLGRLEDAVQALSTLPRGTPQEKPERPAPGDALFKQRKFDEALAAFDAELTASRQVGDTKGERDLLQKIARIHLACGRRDDALSVYQECIRVHHESGDLTGEAGTLSRLADIHRAQGTTDRALECYKAALAIFEQIGAHNDQADVLFGIGRTHLERKELEQASEAFSASLGRYEQSGYMSQKAEVLEAMAWTEAVRTLDAEAPSKLYRQAMGIWKALGKTDRLAQAWLLLGDVYYSLALRSGHRQDDKRVDGLWLARPASHRRGKVR